MGEEKGYSSSPDILFSEALKKIRRGEAIIDISGIQATSERAYQVREAVLVGILSSLLSIWALVVLFLR